MAHIYVRAQVYEKRDLGVPVLAPARPVEKRTLPVKLYADREDALPRPLHAGQTLAQAKSFREGNLSWLLRIRGPRAAVRPLFCDTWGFNTVLTIR